MSGAGAITGSDRLGEVPTVLVNYVLLVTAIAVAPLCRVGAVSEISVSTDGRTSFMDGLLL